jgi:hypothetical protein
MMVVAPAACGQCPAQTDWSQRLGGGGAKMGSLPPGLARNWGRGNAQQAFPAPAAAAASADSPDDVGNAPAAWSCCSNQGN